jgi:hypothetical protein
LRAILLAIIAFADAASDDQAEEDAEPQQTVFRRVAMFSLLSLYFAYRRDVLAAERHVAAPAPDPWPLAA